MNPQIFGKIGAPIVLIIKENLAEIDSDSSSLALYARVYFTPQDYKQALTWTQQNQPSLIILELERFQSNYCNLITLLKLDWLTRDIPILVTGNKSSLQSISYWDCDWFLMQPYSLKELQGILCSLKPNPTCQILV